MGRPKPGPSCSVRIPKICRSRKCSVGYPHPKVQVRLVDGDDRDAEQGVLEMKCPAVMLGYHNRPDVPSPITPTASMLPVTCSGATPTAFTISSAAPTTCSCRGGENVYPTDVERMLERHADVAQAAVVPIDDEIKGQKPVAFVVRKPGRRPNVDEIKRFALANAPAYQHPRFVWFVDELPLASTNKVDRAALRRMAQERLARQPATS